MKKLQNETELDSKLVYIEKGERRKVILSTFTIPFSPASAQIPDFCTTRPRLRNHDLQTQQEESDIKHEQNNRKIGYAERGVLH